MAKKKKSPGAQDSEKKTIKPQASSGGGQQSFQKLKGTSIQFRKGGIPVRVVTADGKEFGPNDIQNAQRYLDKIANQGQKQAGGSWEWVQVPSWQAQGKGAAKGVAKGAAKGSIGAAKGSIAKARGASRVDYLGDQPPWKSGVPQGKGKAPRTSVSFVKAQGSLARAKGVGQRSGSKGAAKGMQGSAPNGPGKKVMKKQKKRKEKELTEEQKEERRQKMGERHEAKILKENRMEVGDDWLEGEIVQRAKSFGWAKLSEGFEVPEDAQAQLDAMNEEFRQKAAEREDSRGFCGGIEENVIYVNCGDIVEDGLVLKPGLRIKFKLYTDDKGVGACEVQSA